MRSLLATGCVLAVLCAFPLFADAPMSKVTIHVTSADSGKPIERAAVVVRFVKGRAPTKLYKKMLTTWETQTNQEGNVVLPSIPQGSVRVQVIAKNFQTFGDLMDVNQEEQTLEIKLNPPQRQYSITDENPKTK
jgi:5-hydroxyisourate hydrolase-like protein (transthyretin family)